MLYFLSTINFVVNCVFVCNAFIEYRYNYFSLYVALMGVRPWSIACSLISGITGGISTLLVDVTIVC